MGRWGFNNKYPYTDFHELNLDWILEQVKANKDDNKAIHEILSSYAEDINNIKTLYQKILNGDIPEDLAAVLIEWIQENAIDIVGDMVKMVFFGITDDGYFVAYIPDSWDEITFNTTGYDYNLSDYDYGHLVLSY